MTIFAASSLTQALDDLAAGYERANPGGEVLLQYGGSSLLATQIIEGARADLFVSANEAQVARVVGEGLATGPPTEIARSDLVLIVPAGNPAGLTGAASLARPGLRLISAPADVPIGQYTREFLARMAAVDDSLPPDYAAAVLANVISFEPNVRQIVTRIELGEADGAIVYRTDTLSPGGQRVEQIDLPPAARVEARYWMLPLTSRAATARFATFVTGDRGRMILQQWGFQTP